MSKKKLSVKKLKKIKGGVLRLGATGYYDDDTFLGGGCTDWANVILFGY